MTQLQRTSETFGGTDQRWLGSREGTDTARTVTLDHDSWTGKVVNGRLKGGEAVALNSSTSKYVPYASGGSNDTNKIVGFVLNDVPFKVNSGDKVVPLLDRGRIIVKYLPSTVAATATLAAGARFSLINVDA
jgi:hypothetical protein